MAAGLPPRGPAVERLEVRKWPNEDHPWTAISSTEYQRYTKEGTSYNEEKETHFLNSFIEGHRGSVLIRDPRVHHGGSPKISADSRPVVATFAYSREATIAHPEHYEPKAAPSAQRSMPRFGQQDQYSNERRFHWDSDEYGRRVVVTWTLLSRPRAVLSHTFSRASTLQRRTLSGRLFRAPCHQHMRFSCEPSRCRSNDFEEISTSLPVCTGSRQRYRSCGVCLDSGCKGNSRHGL